MNSFVRMHDQLVQPNKVSTKGDTCLKMSDSSTTCFWLVGTLCGMLRNVKVHLMQAAHDIFRIAKSELDVSLLISGVAGLRWALV